jgi:putative transcriptional regulator
MSSLAGSFLVAKTSLKDPNFAQAVVLLLAHTPEGAYGVVVNRPLPVEGLPFPLYVGGPCESPGLVLVHGHAEWVDDNPEPADDAPAVKREVAPGIYVGDASCWQRATDSSPDFSPRIRVFRNYAGWGPGQLEGELAAGVWGVTAATGEMLFDTPVEELWDRLAPPRLPQPSLN